MADYERLKGIRATASAKQGDYLYSPRASGSIYGLVKFPDLIKVVDVLPTLTGDIYDGYTFFVHVRENRYRVYSVVGSTATERKPSIDALQDIGNVEAVQPTNGDVLRWHENEGLFVFSDGLGEAESDIVALELEIAKIKNGTTVVKKAECDDEGDIIKNTYVGLVEVDYNDVTNTINVEARTKDGTYLGDDQITLPKATTLKDGLMAKEDKVKVDNIASDISSAITTHDNSATAHLSLRTLINDLQQEIDRLNAKGRSWGEIDLTFTQWFALTEPTRSDYVNTFLANNFSGYTPSNGDLVYTIVSDTEEEHELEYNSTLSQWVDNGAYIVGKASNTQMGIVKGDLTYVSILNGLIQVLKSDYATNVGISGASYDYDDLLALFTEVANDIYKKNETYSATQIEQRITDLLSLANLQDTAIEYETGNYVFPRGAVFPATLVSDYNWVFLRFITAGQEVRYNFFKPTEAITGNYMTVIIQKSPARYARIMRDNGNLKFDIVNDANTVQTDLACTMKMWGIKLDGITAEEVSYDKTGSTLKSTTVQGAIDEHDREIEELKYAPVIERTMGERIESTLGDFVPNDNGKPLLKEVNGMQLYAPQLVTNGDLTSLTDFNLWTKNAQVTFDNVNNRTIIDTTNAVSLVSPLLSNQPAGQKLYFLLNGYSSNIAPINIRYELDGSLNSQTALLTNVPSTKNNFSNIITFTEGYDKFAISRGTVGVLFYLYTFNVYNISTLIANKQYSPIYNTTFDLMTDAQIKIQMDSWVQLGILPNANLQAVTNTKIKSVGKNLFDGVYQNYKDINTTTGEIITYESAWVVIDYIRIMSSTSYTFTFPSAIGYRVFYYDVNKNYISYQSVTTNFTTPSNCKYIRLRIALPFTDGIQLEQGTVATTYAPYKSGTLELTHTPLYRLPNGVKDIVRYDNGQYVKDKYVQEYTLTADDIDLMVDIGSNVDYARIRVTNMLNIKPLVRDVVGQVYMPNYIEVTSSSYNNVNNINKYFVFDGSSFNFIGFVVAKGTTLAAAKTALAGTKIYYQLATPLLANELVNADGQLIQENPTTLIQEQTLNTEYDIDFTIDTKKQVVTNMNNVALKADKTYVDSKDALKAPIASPSLTGTTTITRTEADGITAMKVEKSNGSATGNIAEYYFNGVKVGQVDKAGVFSGGVEQTVANKNKHLPLLGRSNNGSVVARFGTATWNGSSWVTDNASFGFGNNSLQNNTGANSNGFGSYSLENNTGADSNGFGRNSLRFNTGSESNGFGRNSLGNNTVTNSNGFGNYSLENNTGANSSGFGTNALQNNTGTNSNGFGYYSLRFNQKVNNTAVGHNAYGEFLTNSAGAKTFDYTAIDTTLERATIVSHSFGATNEVVNLKYTATSGTAIGGIALNEIFQAKIIDANTIEFVNGSQKRNITSQGTGTHTFTPQFAYTNTTSLGANTVPNKDNQVVLGDNAVDTIKMGGTFRTPASSSATGVKGEWCYDANYIYVCTATNQWKRTAITTW